MPNTFFCSDHHFGHHKLYDTFIRPGTTDKFLRYDLAASVAEGDELLIERHNSVVRDNDRVYILGDFCFSRRVLPIASRLRGRKVLIKGNHDTLKLSEYALYFDDIRAVHKIADIGVMTHVPLHPICLTRWGVNIHGHLHTETMMDTRYLNVSMECINYTPISLEEVRKAINDCKTDILIPPRI